MEFFPIGKLQENTVLDIPLAQNLDHKFQSGSDIPARILDRVGPPRVDRSGKNRRQ
jgi:hypothetical protein